MRLPLLIGIAAVLSIAAMPVTLAGPTTSGDFTTVEITPTGGFPEGGNLAVSPEDSSTWIMAQCTSDEVEVDIGIYKTTDGGDTWSPVEVDTGSDLRPCAVSYHPTDASKVALGFNDAGLTRVAVSTDGGDSFGTPVTVENTGGNDYVIGTWWKDADSLGIAYVRDDNDDLKTAMSNDTGATWDAPVVRDPTTVNSDFAPTWFHQLKDDSSWLRVISPEETVFSTDGGVTWGQASANMSDATVSASLDEFSWSPVNKTHWVGMTWDSNAATNTELVETTDSGATWTSVVQFSDDWKPFGCSQGNATIWACASLDQSSAGTNITYTEDSGSTYVNVTALAPSACAVNQPGGCRSYGHVQPTAGQYVAVVGDDGPRTVAFSSPVIPADWANTQNLTATATDTGIGHGVDLAIRKNVSVDHVWVKDRVQAVAANGNDKLWRFQGDLTRDVEATICTGAGDYNGAAESFTEFGLTATVDGFVVVDCEGETTTVSRLLMHNADGSFDISEDQTHVMRGLPAGIPMGSWTGNKLAYQDKDGSDVSCQLDAITLSETCVSFDPESVAVSWFDNRWIALAGSSGTRVANNLGGGVVIPDLQEPAESVAIVNDTLVTHDRDDDTLASWRINPGSGATLLATSEFATAGDHDVALSLGGNYTVATGSANVTVFWTANMTPILRTNETLTELVRADLTADNTELIVLNRTQVRTYDVSGILDAPTVTVTGQTVGGAVSDTGTAAEPKAKQSTGVFSSDAITGVGNALGVNTLGAQIVFAGFLIAGMALCGGMLGREFSAGDTGAFAASLGGVAISYGLGLIPTWLLVVFGLLALAFVLARGN